MDIETIERYRKDFPITRKYRYLDHAGVAPLSARVRDTVREFVESSSLEGQFRNVEWTNNVEKARSNCGTLINAEADEIAFTRSTSHGLSLVANGLDWKKGDNVVYCESDFPSNIFPWQRLERRYVECRPVPIRAGRVEIRDLENRIDDRTRLVAVSSVQFVSGFRIDLKTLGSICRKKGVLFCVDAIQSLGLFPLDVKACSIDFLSADAHKWLIGPEGIGIFYCRKGLAETVEPVLIGWKSVLNEFSFERPRLELKTNALRFEEGSQNIMGIVALGAAVKLLLEIGIDKIGERVLDLGDMIIQEASQRGFAVISPKTRHERGGGVSFSGSFDPVSMRDLLRAKGIMVNVRGGGLRVSPHFYNTEQEITGLFAAIDDIVQRL